MAVHGWGVRGLVSQLRDGVRYYYHFDGLGSMMQVTDGNQNIVASYKYDAWGNDLTDPQSLLPYPFKYVVLLEVRLKFVRVNTYEAMGVEMVGSNGLLSHFRSMAENGKGFLSISSLT